MPKVVGIKFKRSQKVYFFEAGNHEYAEGAGAIVETARGIEFGRVASLPENVDDSRIVQPLKPVIRIATEADERRNEANESKREFDMELASKLIAKSGLNMKLVGTERTFDENKLVINFSAEGRVDFRELVREMAQNFHMRIELRQIGARDECKLIGGLGPCGKECCCSQCLKDYPHVTIKMAKNQNLSLNPGKISGLCGRLMCCLEYENAHYVETNKKMPKLGSLVKTSDGREGTVTSVNQLKETVRLKVPDKDLFVFTDVPLKEIVKKGKETMLDEIETASVDEEVLKNME